MFFLWNTDDYIFFIFPDVDYSLQFFLKFGTLRYGLYQRPKDNQSAARHQNRWDTHGGRGRCEGGVTDSSPHKVTGDVSSLVTVRRWPTSVATANRAAMATGTTVSRWCFCNKGHVAIRILLQHRFCKQGSCYNEVSREEQRSHREHHTIGRLQNPYFLLTCTVYLAANGFLNICEHAAN